MAAPPFGRENHMFFGISEPGAVAETAGFSIESPVGSLGATLMRYEPLNGSVINAFRQTTIANALLDTNLQVITPNIVSDESAARVVIFRTGRNLAGVIAAEPDYFFRAEAFSPFQLPNGGMYVPPGFTLTVFAIATDVNMIGSFGVIEYLPAPT